MYRSIRKFIVLPLLSLLILTSIFALLLSKTAVLAAKPPTATPAGVTPTRTPTPQAGPTATPQTPVIFNYGEALQKGIWFYDAQRSGPLPATNRVFWRGDSGMNDVPTGGWYDAGDHVKFGFPMAASATMLGWSLVEYRTAYQNSGQLTAAEDNLKWAADYFVSAHTAPNELVGQVGTGSVDHGWWGPAEVMQMARPSFKITASCPGSDLAAETAAALAAAYMVLGDANYLTHAQQLYTFADTYRGAYSDCITDARNFYKSWSGYNDELVWGALWLYRATGNQAYLSKAESYYANLANQTRQSVKSYKWGHAWDDKSYGSYILLAKLTGNQQYHCDAQRWLNWWTVGGTGCGADGSKVTYTPGGLAWLDQWGALRYAANTSFIALVYADLLGPANPLYTRYHDFAKRQIDYALGANPRNSSYVVGFGANPPKNPHHRTGHGPWYDDIDDPTNNVHTLFGALVGGPGNNDAYTDSRTDYVKNEVATDYNAGFVGALARLYQEFGGAPLANFPQNYTGAPYEIYRTEYFSRVRLLSDSATSTGLAIQTTNRSAWPATVKDKMSTRYFFDLTELFNAGYTVSNVTVTLGTNEGATVSGPYLWSGNVYYIVVNFTGTKIFPGGRPNSEKQANVTLSAPVWNSQNDWSRQGLVNSPFTYEPVDETGKTQYVPVYDNGVLLWGTEPPR